MANLTVIASAQLDQETKAANALRAQGDTRSELIRIRDAIGNAPPPIVNTTVTVTVTGSDVQKKVVQRNRTVKPAGPRAAIVGALLP